MQKRIKNGLDKVQASIVDIDQSSLFDIFIPKQLRLGKNEIKIRLVSENGLLRGSEILIDILDQNGNPLYYEISNIANEDNSRSIIVSIEEDDLTGNGKLYLYSNLTLDSTYLCIINLEINPGLENEQEIKFSSPPEIYYQEKKVGIQNFSSQTRVLYRYSSTSTISTISPIIPKQLQRGIFDIEQKEIQNNTSNGSVSNGIATSSLVSLPDHSALAIFTTENFSFSSSFQTGQVWVNNLNLEIPTDALDQNQFRNKSYSGSIINVLSTSSIEVYPPFQLSIDYDSTTGKKTKIYDRFVNQTNFTCSYFDVLSLSQGSYTQSYAVFDIFNLNPNIGKVDSIDISYKNLSLVGNNYEPLGNFKIESQTILTDPNNLGFDPKNGIIEKDFGIFKSGYNQYWQTSSLPNLVIDNRIPDGISLYSNNQILQIKQGFMPIADSGQWILSLDYSSEFTSSNAPQLDFYISGSELGPILENSTFITAPGSSQQLGTYIGSITEKRGRKEFLFELNKKSKITPKIRPTSGVWVIGNIKLQPNYKNGSTTKQTRVYAPLNIPTGSELNFKFEYVGPSGKKTSTFSSLLPGVYFEGSYKPSNSLSIPNGTVSGSDQLTGSFDGRYERRGTGILSSSRQIATEISGAFSDVSSSLSSRTSIIESTTANLNLYTGSANTRFSNIESRTGSYATTGSNQFNGNQIVTGSVIATSFSGTFNNIPSSSQQIKNLLPTGIASGSEQFTSSYDSRYHRLGTGLYSSSQQIDYNQIINKPQVSSSGLYQLLISSGSDSSSYSSPNLKYDTSQSKLILTGSVYMTGSKTPRISLTWYGSITPGTTPGIVWTNMPAAKTNWLNSGPGTTNDSTYITNLTEMSDCRLFTFINFAAATATSSISVEYSSDAVSWNNLISLTIGNSIGFKDTSWSRIPAGAIGEYYVRLVGQGGDGYVDPRFSPPTILFR